MIDMDFTHAILFGWLGLAVFMAILWSVQRRSGNAGIVDRRCFKRNIEHFIVIFR